MRKQVYVSLPEHEVKDFEADIEAIGGATGLPDDSKIIRYAVRKQAELERAK